ncbi:hypothetical protein [Streptomyces sp. NPDC087437]|uniref:hypothetical protein n=1 Tax=Streptomyces sp. NPDC087437 TaxID=3365789 RepID=UPI0038023E6B
MADSSVSSSKWYSVPYHHPWCTSTSSDETAADTPARIPGLERIYICGVYSPAKRRVRDPANWYPSFKAAIDGLTDKKRKGQVLTVGVLSDDSDEHVVGPVMRLGDVVTRSHITMLIWDLTRQAGSAAGEAPMPGDRPPPRRAACAVGAAAPAVSRGGCGPSRSAAANTCRTGPWSNLRAGPGDRW